MRLLITRHAETTANEQNLLQDEKSKLSLRGVGQISKLTARLRNENINLIISSDFDRCVLTAREIAKLKKIDLEESSLVREKYDGDWIGKSSKEINWDSLAGSLESRRAPNGENLLEVRQRGIEFLNLISLRFAKSDATILLVSHSTFLRVLIGNIIGLSIEDSIFNISMDNCSLTEIEISNKHRKGYRLKYLNETSFLKN